MEAIICDWCCQPATRVTPWSWEPMCTPHARMNFGADFRTETVKLGVRARKEIERKYSAD